MVTTGYAAQSFCEIVKVLRARPIPRERFVLVGASFPFSRDYHCRKTYQSQAKQYCKVNQFQ